jgi:hypothetical protein
MANRDTRFLIKRSNVPGKIPTNGDLLLGELGLNTADAILYTSGTTANTILPIGWDRVARTGDTMTGGLFTPFLSATTISAETITLKNYIDFNTGTTAPTNVSGRVFYDGQSRSLAYYSNIDNVKVEMGQQLYIRGFNNTGSIIPKGTVLSIQSATNGFPNFTPAVISHRGFSQVVGLAASDIQINAAGLALSQGILSGITVNSFNVGDILYASPFSAGTYVASTATFPFSARTNQVGFVIATGTTTGQIYVSINNEDENLTLTDIERNILEGNVISTGTYEFTGMTTASTTTFNIAPMRAWVVRNTYEYATLPDVVNLYYTGGTNISVTNLASADSTYILITTGLTVTQQVTFPTPQQRRENIFLGKVNHPNRTSILNINNTVDYDVSPMSALRDLWSPIKLINQGIIPSPNGANLSFNTSAGILWGNGINWHNNQLSPNNVNIAAKVPASFNYRTQTGGTSTSVTVIDPRNYDVGGVITSIGNANLDNATNQRIYIYPTGVINVLYGQTVYSNLTAAVAAVQSETFIPYPNAEANGILIGVLSVRNDIGTDGQSLTNLSYAKFTFVSKFGESFGGTGGLSTTTLQQAYDNSTSPEIVTDATLGALSIKNGAGTADNVTRLFEGINTAGNATSFIRADGDISGTTIQTGGFTANTTGVSGTTIQTNGFTANTIGLSATTVSATTIVTGGFRANATGLSATTVSATTYYNLPIDVYTTGGTRVNNSLIFTNNTGGTFTVTGTTPSLQEVYTASTAPRITTNNTLGSLRIRGGTGSDLDNNFIIENNTGDVTSYWNANGDLVLKSISATTYYNLPTDIRVTGGSYNQISGVATFTNNTGGTFTVNGFSTGGGGSFTGGTVTGPTNFINGLSANTISATTYYNLPIDVYTTGATYSNGTAVFKNNTGGTFNLTGLYTGATDVYVTGGTYTEGVTTFKNNTGGTFNVTGTTTYAAGVISGSTGWSSTGTGQINLPNVKVALYNNANNIEPILIYDLVSGTTNSGGIPALANNDTNYVVIEYNGGSPKYNVYDNDAVVDDSSVVLFMVVYRADNFIHTLEFGNQGAGLANKLNDRFIMTDRFGYESGLALGLSGSTGVVTLTAGVAWNGPNRQSLAAINSQDQIFFKNFHSGGTWVYTTTGDTLNNTYYDNGTNIVAATAGKYLTNWYFRGQEINDHIYEVYSTNQYDSVALGQLATEPVLPELISSHAILVGRIIVLVGANTGLTESAFVTTFQPTNVTAHNDLNAIQGGTAGQYYHLTANQYNNIALTNVNNNFSVGQSFTSGITANTISATTITTNSLSSVSVSATTLSGGTIYGDGLNITNIPVPYGIINALANFNFLS